MKRNSLLALNFLCIVCSSCSTEKAVDFKMAENFYDDIFDSSKEVNAESITIEFCKNSSDPTYLDESYHFYKTITSNEFEKINDSYVRLKPEYLSDHKVKYTLNIKVGCYKNYFEDDVWSKNYEIVYNFEPYTQYINELYKDSYSNVNGLGDYAYMMSPKENFTYKRTGVTEALGKNFEFYGLPYCYKRYEKKESGNKKGYYYFWFFDFSKRMFSWVELHFHTLNGYVYETSRMKIKKYFFDDNPRFEGLSIGTFELSTSSGFITPDLSDVSIYNQSCLLNEIFKSYSDNQYVTSIHKGGATWNRNTTN